MQRGADGGLLAPAPGDEPLLLELHRAGAELSGQLRSFDRQPESGRRCPVSFALRVSRCTATELQVVAELAYGLAPDCSRLPGPDGGPAQPALAEYVWERK